MVRLVLEELLHYVLQLCMLCLYIYVQYVISISNHNAEIHRRGISLLQEPAMTSLLL